MEIEDMVNFAFSPCFQIYKSSRKKERLFSDFQISRYDLRAVLQWRRIMSVRKRSCFAPSQALNATETISSKFYPLVDAYPPDKQKRNRRSITVDTNREKTLVWRVEVVGLREAVSSKRDVKQQIIHLHPN